MQLKRLTAPALASLILAPLLFLSAAKEVAAQARVIMPREGLTYPGGCPTPRSIEITMKNFTIDEDTFGPLHPRTQRSRQHAEALMNCPGAASILQRQQAIQRQQHRRPGF